MDTFFNDNKIMYRENAKFKAGDEDIMFIIANLLQIEKTGNDLPEKKYEDLPLA